MFKYLFIGLPLVILSIVYIDIAILLAVLYFLLGSFSSEKTANFLDFMLSKSKIGDILTNCWEEFDSR